MIRPHLLTSLPPREAWIEISMGEKISVNGRSLPSWEAWIEIL